MLHFDPKTVNAAIVTCGGLCPGLNNVIREITNPLCQIYGIGGKVYGIQGGYRGFYEHDTLPLIVLKLVSEDVLEKNLTSPSHSLYSHLFLFSRT